MRGFLLRLLGIGKKILAIFKPFFKGEIAKFLENVKPMVLEAIEQAMVKADLSNKEKFDFVKDQIEAGLKDLGMEYKERYVNLAIELFYNSVKINM